MVDKASRLSTSGAKGDFSHRASPQELIGSNTYGENKAAVGGGAEQRADVGATNGKKQRVHSSLPLPLSA